MIKINQSHIIEIFCWY